jgi:hypothetical protein
MIYFLIIVLLALMGMVVVSLFRGLNSFRQEIDGNIDPEGARELQLKQNRMMWARIKYQLAAVIVIGVILLAGR